MSVTLLRAYGGFANGAVVTLADDTESALITQGLATAGPTTAVTKMPGGTIQRVTVGGNLALPPQGEQGYSVPASAQGPLIWPNIALGSAALTGYETNGATQVVGTWQYGEIYVPYFATWTGAGFLNGTTVATGGELATVALWGSNGALLANSAVAGAATANASVFQNMAFVNAAQVATPITLPPGRYFIGLQLGGTGATNTVRHILAANGSNVICGSVTGTVGTVPATITVPTTFTTAVAPIMQLYQ